MLGLYVSENEGANFWLQVLTDLANRGVNDILIACIDGLKGFPEAIEAMFPKTEVQLCVVHQIRNSLKYVASKNQKEFMADLKRVYKANSKDIAEVDLDTLDAKWVGKYPIVIRSWRNNWERLSQYFKYPEEIRKIIYTTNTIETVHRQFRKLTKTKGAFPNQDRPHQAALPWHSECPEEVDDADPELVFGHIAAGNLLRRTAGPGIRAWKLRGMQVRLWD